MGILCTYITFVGPATLRSDGKAFVYKRGQKKTGSHLFTCCLFADLLLADTCFLVVEGKTIASEIYIVENVWHLTLLLEEMSVH